MAIGAYCLFTSNSRIQIQSQAMVVLIACLLSWACLSTLWSPDRSETIRELFRIIVYTGFAYSLARRFPSNELAIVLLFAFATGMCFAAFAEFFVGAFKPWQAKHRLAGTLHANDLGRIAIVVAVGAYAYLQNSKPKWFWLGLAIVALAILFLTKSRTSFFSLFIGVFTVHLVKQRGLNLLGFLAIILLGAGTIVLSIEIGGAGKLVDRTISMGRAEKSTSLTGRLPLWQEVLKQAKDRQWTGVGYGAYWTVERTKDMFEELEWYPRHAHSIYVETIVNIGYIGLAMMLALCLLTLVHAVSQFNATKQVAYIAFAALIVAQLAYGFSEAAPVLPRDQGIFNLSLMFSVLLSHFHESKTTV